MMFNFHSYMVNAHDIRGMNIISIISVSNVNVPFESKNVSSYFRISVFVNGTTNLIKLEIGFVENIVWIIQRFF